jgi:hypothetical protein
VSNGDTAAGIPSTFSNAHQQTASKRNEEEKELLTYYGASVTHHSHIDQSCTSYHINLPKPPFFPTPGLVPRRNISFEISLCRWRYHRRSTRARIECCISCRVQTDARGCMLPNALEIRRPALHASCRIGLGRSTHTAGVWIICVGEVLGNVRTFLNIPSNGNDDAQPWRFEVGSQTDKSDSGTASGIRVTYPSCGCSRGIVRHVRR